MIYLIQQVHLCIKKVLKKGTRSHNGCRIILKSQTFKMRNLHLL